MKNKRQDAASVIVFLLSGTIRSKQEQAAGCRFRYIPLYGNEGVSVMPELTHFDVHGQAIMVDVGDKEVTRREAVARASVLMSPQTLKIILDGKAKKGDVLGVARVAGIMAAKKTPDIIPLAHPIPLSSVSIEFYPDAENSVIVIEARVRVAARTGVEMEALTAVTCAGLTIYDMCKAVDRSMVISDVMLVEKSGGRSGIFKRT
jgi:cyclic pyranopterin monophosphate synthase